MTEQRFQISRFFAELSRRKVIRVAVTYGVVGFAVIEAADIIVDAINLPPQFVAFVIVAIFLGLPVAIVLAWSYELVPDRTAQKIQATEATGSISDHPHRRTIRTIRFAVAATVIAVTWFVWAELRSQGTIPEDTTANRYAGSIAVLPFDNLTGDPAYDHLGIGITEELNTHLARIPQLKVISRHSAQVATLQNLTFPQLAIALNVQHIIEGSVRLNDGNVQITLQHLDAEIDHHLWAESFIGPIDDLVGLQERIARYATMQIVDVIPGLTLPRFSTHVELGAVQEAYFIGKRALEERTSGGLRTAISLFQSAIELDSTYAPAYADLASAFALAIFYRYDIGPDYYTLAAKSLAFADRAISLDANLAAGYATRGYLGALVGRSEQAVAADFNRAVALQPNAANIPSWRSRSLAQLAEFDAAVAEAHRAIDLDPLSSARHIALAELSLQLGDYDQAISSAQMATALEPRIFRSRAIEARALLLSGDPERCASLLLGPHRILRASCLRRSGRELEAQVIIDKTLDALRAGNTVTDYATRVILYEDLAVEYALRGDAESTLFWAARAYAASPAGLEIRILESALFDLVRDDPNFSSSIAAIRADLFDRVQRDSQKFRQ